MWRTRSNRTVWLWRDLWNLDEYRSWDQLSAHCRNCSSQHESRKLLDLRRSREGFGFQARKDNRQRIRLRSRCSSHQWNRSTYVPSTRSFHEQMQLAVRYLEFWSDRLDALEGRETQANCLRVEQGQVALVRRRLRRRSFKVLQTCPRNPATRRFGENTDHLPPIEPQQPPLRLWTRLRVAQHQTNALSLSFVIIFINIYHLEH